MKMLKKAASIALASAMVFSLAACGSGNGGSSEGNSDATTFKIGSIGPITGDTAIYGTAVQNGIQGSTAIRSSISLRMIRAIRRNLSLHTIL